MDETIRLPVPVDLFIAHAPRHIRANWRWLWLLDQKFTRLVGEVSEPMLAQIRLAWWREQLTGQGRSEERRDPYLLQLDAMGAEVRPVFANAALSLAEAHEALATGDDSDVPKAQSQRGAAFTVALAQSADTDHARAEAIGAYWALVQLPQSSITEQIELIRAVRQQAEGRTLRALSLMRCHAAIIERSEGRIPGRGAGLRLSLHALTGL